MAKQRDKIRMSDAEITAFLDDCKSLHVATLDKDGAPHLTTLWFAVQDGKILFETYAVSQKVMNLRRDPRLAVLCEQGTTYDQLRGVSIKGMAQIVESGPECNTLMKAIVMRNNPGLPANVLAQHVTEMTRKRIVVVVHPEKVISWDHRKLAQA